MYWLIPSNGLSGQVCRISHVGGRDPSSCTVFFFIIIVIIIRLIYLEGRVREERQSGLMSSASAGSTRQIAMTKAKSLQFPPGISRSTST